MAAHEPAGEPAPGEDAAVAPHAAGPAARLVALPAAQQQQRPAQPAQAQAPWIAWPPQPPRVPGGDCWVCANGPAFVCCVMCKNFICHRCFPNCQCNPESLQCLFINSVAVDALGPISDLEHQANSAGSQRQDVDENASNMCWERCTMRKWTIASALMKRSLKKRKGLKKVSTLMMVLRTRSITNSRRPAEINMDLASVKMAVCTMKWLVPVMQKYLQHKLGHVIGLETDSESSSSSPSAPSAPPSDDL
jgi:hypothetical protein